MPCWALLLWHSCSASRAAPRSHPDPLFVLALTDLTSDDVGMSAAFLLSDMSGSITGTTMYVDNGMHAMGMVQSKAVEQLQEY